MALVNRTFTLDITPGAIPQVVNVSEYDQNRQYTVTLVDEGGVFEIPSGTTATIEGTLAGHPFSVEATVSGNTVTFSLDESMTAYAGDAWTKIKLTKDGKPVQTCAFILRCDKAGAEAKTIINAPGFQGQIDEAVAKRFDTNLKILVLGNSFAQDSFAYLPAVLGELLPGYKITYGVAYTDSFDPSDHLTAYNNGTKYTNWNLWRDDADHWSRYAGSGAKGQNLAGILGLYDWDIIYLQCAGSIGETMETSMTGNNIVPARQLLRIFQQTLTNPFVFLTGQWLSTVGETEADTLASYFRMRKAMEYVSDRLGVDGVIPVGAGIAFARTDATLDALGESGHMLYDWNSETKHGHQQAGLPALISTYVIAQYILGLLGREDVSVYGSTFVPNLENATAINATNVTEPSKSMTHGEPVGVTTENILKAQEIAVAAAAHPDSVYGETDPSEGGSGAVTSVNGKTGAVVLDAEDVGALPDDTVIPAAVTEQTVAGWGFTKNTGTYSKPSGGIPASDLADGVIPTVPQMASQADMSDWTAGKTVDAAAVGEAIAAIDTGGSGFTAQFVTAFSNFLDHLSGVFDDPNGQTYIDALKNALQGGESSDGITFLNGVLQISETASVTATQSGSTLALA